MKELVVATVARADIRLHQSFSMASFARPLLFMVLLFLSFAAGRVSAQCTGPLGFYLSGPTTTWNDGNGSWGVDGNWTSGAPNASTNACILDGTSTVTLETNGNANGVLLASGNSLNINAGAGLSLSSGGTSFDFGTISNAGAVTNNGSMEVDLRPSTLINDSGGFLTNNGTISLVAGGALNNSGGYLANDGTISGIQGFLSNSGTFINNSAISLSFDSSYRGGAFDNGGYFANSGTISADTLPFVNSGTINNSGTISVRMTGAPSYIANSGTLNNTGTINFSLGWDTGSIANSGTINNSGTMNVDDGCVFGGCSSGNASSVSNSGTINNSGTLNISARGSAGGDFTNSGTLNNSGTLSNNATSTIDNTGAINNSGTIINMLGASLVNAGTINNTGTFTNSGAVTVSNSGLFTTSSNYTQTGGSTVVDGTLSATGGAVVDIQGGTLGGTGTIDGNVVNGGTLMPGDAPGALMIDGNYEQADMGVFDELISPLSQSLLVVDGNATLDPGSLLEITLLDGYDPLGQTFDIMDFSSLQGEFSNGSSFWDDGYLWDLSYGQNQIDVSAVSAPEPSSALLLFVGLFALGLYSHRKMSKMQRPA